MGVKSGFRKWLACLSELHAHKCELARSVYRLNNPTPPSTFLKRGYEIGSISISISPHLNWELSIGSGDLTGSTLFSFPRLSKFATVLSGNE